MPNTTSTVNPNSIRQICLRGFLAGKPRTEIAAEIQAAHPDSAAARKSVKHIAWHYGDMKKRGLLADAAGVKATVAATVATEVPAPSADDLELERLLAVEAAAAEMAARIDAELAAE